MDSVAWLKELLTRLQEKFPPTHAVLMLVEQTLAVSLLDGEEQITVGLPDIVFTLSPGEVVDLVVKENSLRKGRKLNITFHPPTLAHVEWNCTVCGVTRLECKCAGGPSRF